MDNKTSDYPDYNFTENIKKEDKNITCKDGYCFIPNAKKWRNNISQLSIKGSLNIEKLITLTNELKSMGY